MAPHVVRVITRLNIGGPARQALLLTRELSPEYSTALVAGTAPPEEGELLDAGVPVIRIPLVRSVRPHRDLAAFHALRRLVDQARPQIVHTHMAKAGTLGRLAAWSSRARPRTVHTFHGHVMEGYFSRWANRAIVSAERSLAARTDVLVAVSSQTRDELLSLGIGAPEQFRVIPLGLDLREHLLTARPTGELRSALELPGEVPLIGVVGRLVEIKDLPTLFRALARVGDCHLAVLGGGPLRGQLEDLALELDIAERTHFVGWWRDIPGAMSDLDIVALSSRNEGTPVALIEAAACGRAVVATDVGGVRTVVVDGVTGSVVPAGDVAALASALSRLLGDATLRHQMGSAGRIHVAARFTADRLVADIRELYGELI